ncbi:TonB-dependent receptor [Parabacteroides chinchillae]|uniref:Outer membrane receptor proteins, mostly Fe transport n=1 Tax=Parabacteroides chinchillae TaxID=871327 RepID=A0A8G2F2I7_9BACT|nr:TonB-dependent receptor [Parabacteroides chinchillae]SEG23264.1 Outer membrane receptor proteins, mostly Fe transport [Parabacteroides chinchillae]
MKQHYLSALAVLTLLAVQTVTAEEVHNNDTIKTYNLNDVVITSSTKETNNLRTLPGSVSILSPQQIAGRQIEVLKDISSFVPNLYMPDYGAKLTSAIYIRGIGARSSGQSVGLYVDNVPYLDKSTFDFDLTDIQRIEVLRGPQGTLYGRNAMGGIINVYTISPFDFQGKKLSVAAGSYGQYTIKASHYGKLSNTIGFTAGVYYDHNDGFYTNEYTGKRVDKGDVAGGRIKLEGRFTPNFRIVYSLSADYTNQGAFAYGLYNKETGKIEPVRFNDPSSYKRTMVNNNLSLEYKTDKFVFSSTTGYQYFKDDMKMDQDFDTLSMFTLNQKQKQNAVSQEIAFKSNTKKDYQWSFGLYGFYDALHTEGPVNFKEDGIKNILQKTFDDLKEQNPKMPQLVVMDENLLIPGSFDTPSYGVALFHQSTYNNLFVKGLSITAGIRLDYEKQKMTYNSEARMKMGVSFNGSPAMELDKFFPYPTSKIDESISQDFWQVLPKVSLKYECTPTTFTYLSVAKGYKTGGYNVQMSADVMKSQMQYDMMKAVESMLPFPIKEPLPLDEVSAYKPEYSWNYEAGIRSELINGRLSAEFTLFYMDIRDLQLTKFVDSGNGRILTNAGKARSVGTEISLRARLTGNLTADVNYGFTRATFRNYISEKKANSEIISTDCKGNFIPYTPRHTLNIGVQYTKLIQNCWLDQFTVSAQFCGTGKIFWTEYNDITQNFYGTLNAKAGVRKGIVNVNLWSRNITNTDYAAFYFESLDRPFVQKGKPFQIGAEIAIAF